MTVARCEFTLGKDGIASSARTGEDMETDGRKYSVTTGGDARVCIKLRSQRHLHKELVGKLKGLFLKLLSRDSAISPHFAHVLHDQWLNTAKNIHGLTYRIQLLFDTLIHIIVGLSQHAVLEKSESMIAS